jgi:type II secretory pathway pseudopilin PulG
MIGNNKKINNSGFSLIEIVVSVSIFVFVVLMVTSIFQNSIVVQKNAISSQTVQEGLRYALEVISKETRSAVANLDPADPVLSSCPLGAINPTYKVFNYDDDTFYFRNRHGDCVYYYLDTVDHRLMIERNDGVNSVVLPITPAHIRVDSFAVTLDDDAIGAFPEIQPNVSFVMEVESTLSGFKESMRLQTSITSRHYE